MPASLANATTAGPVMVSDKQPQIEKIGDKRVSEINNNGTVPQAKQIEKKEEKAVESVIEQVILAPGSHYKLTLLDILVYFLLTPLILLFAILKMIPKCANFQKKIIKMHRTILYLILVSNLIKCLAEMVDLLVLQHQSSGSIRRNTDSPYCEVSGSI